MARLRGAILLLPFILALAACAPAPASAATAPGGLSSPGLDFRVDDRVLALAAGAPSAEPRDPGALKSPLPAGRGGETNPLVAMGKSLLIPGWGQLATGHHTQAAVFAALEFGTWAAFGTFERQGALRRSSYFATAQQFAGIDLKGKTDDMRRLVGQYQSNDVYNQFVVLREAAYFFSDSVSRAQFIAAHYLGPDDAWSWDSFDAFQVYRAQRRSSEQAFQRARYALGFAVVNRFVSALAAARQAAALRKAARAADVGGVPGRPSASLAVDVAPGRGLVPDARLACVIRF
jgi:hypothetical protein